MLEISGIIMLAGVLIALVFAGAALGTAIGVGILLVFAFIICVVLGTAFVAMLGLVVRVLLALLITLALKAVFLRALAGIGKATQMRWLDNFEQREKLSLLCSAVIAAWICFIKF